MSGPGGPRSRKSMYYQEVVRTIWDSRYKTAMGLRRSPMLWPASPPWRRPASRMPPCRPPTQRPPRRRGRARIALPRFASLKADEVNVRTGPGPRYPVDWVFKSRNMPSRSSPNTRTGAKYVIGRDERLGPREPAAGKRGFVIPASRPACTRARPLGGSGRQAGAGSDGRNPLLCGRLVPGESRRRQWLDRALRPCGASIIGARSTRADAASPGRHRLPDRELPARS